MQGLTNVGYPRNLSFITKRLNGYVRNNIRLQSIANNTASAGQVITVDLPSNAIIDCSTLQMFFQGSTSSTAGSCSFPRDIHQTITRCEVEINGTLVSTSCPYLEILYSILADTQYGADAKNRRSILNNAGNQGIPAANVTNQYLSINNFLSFIGSVAPNCINTSLLGNVRLRLTLASPNVLIQTANCTGANYTFNNIVFSVDVIDIKDGIYHDLQQKFLQSGAAHEYVFHNYYSFSTPVSGSFNTSLKFSLSTQSLNRAWAAFVHAYPYNLVSIGGVTTTAAAYDPIRQDSSYFTRLSGGTNGSTIVYSSGNSIDYLMNNYQYNINNVATPNWLVPAEYAHGILTSGYGINYDTVHGGDPNLNSMNAWLSAYSVFHTKLDHGGDGSGLISGINTSGNISQAYCQITGPSWVVTGTAVPANVLGVVFVESSASLMVAANRQLQLIL